MPDLQNFSITRNGSVSASIPQFTIKCDVTDSTTGMLIKSLSGTFPQSLSTFTTAQIEQAFRDMILQLLLIKANGG